MNRTIKLLMFSDVFVSTGFGLIEPILAIFIKENLIGGTIFAAGMASTIFFLTKCIIQLPFSKYVDKHDHKIRYLLIGSLLIALVPFLYAFAKHINTIYLAQFVYGIGAGLAYPAWLGLWSTNLDKHNESFEWSMYSTFVGVGIAATAAIGAGLAQFIGYHATFFIVGFMSLIGCAIIFFLDKKQEKLKKTPIHHYHKKRKLVKNHR
ncbi:MFS transporter [Candidatus Woesearchaeota archaeon]|nr:MFS transporter [Candidatus Woesearchaeota archaeon]